MSRRNEFKSGLEKAELLLKVINEANCLDQRTLQKNHVYRFSQTITSTTIASPYQGQGSEHFEQAHYLPPGQNVSFDEAIYYGPGQNGMAIFFISICGKLAFCSFYVTKEGNSNKIQGSIEANTDVETNLASRMEG